jgi:hypothetical protein
MDTKYLHGFDLSTGPFWIAQPCVLILRPVIRILHDLFMDTVFTSNLYIYNDLVALALIEISQNKWAITLP